MTALARCERLVVGHGKKPLLSPIDLEIDRGQLWIVLGGNGTGKTTWVKTLLGLLPPVSGRVVFSSPRPHLAYIPQASEIDELSPVRVRDVVGWGSLRKAGFLWPIARTTDRKRRDRALREAGCAELAKKQVRDLSGGQRQRMLLARALATDADLMVLDEPTAALDVKSEQAVYAQLAALARDRKIGIVAVTHAVTTALAHATKVALFDREGAQGGTVHTGDPATMRASAAFRTHLGEARP